MAHDLRIDYARCILLILVLFCHTDLTEFAGYDEICDDVWPTYRVISSMISRIICQCAVPCFFVISGYLYFRTCNKFGWHIYIQKTKRRIYNLCLPYLVWNFLFIVVIYGKNLIFKVLGLEVPDDAYHILSSSTFQEALWFDPINSPLWYLRNLICLSFVTPIIYIFIKYCGLPYLIILSIIYLLPNEVIPHHCAKALFFFSIGVYLSIKSIDIFNYHKHLYKIAIFITMIACVSAFIHSNHFNLWENIVTISGAYILFGTIATITNGEERCTKYDKMVMRISSISFFVYAVHMIYLLPWTKGIMSRLPWDHIQLGHIINYILTPIVCLFFGAIIEMILKRMSTKAHKLLVGRC